MIFALTPRLDLPSLRKLCKSGNFWTMIKWLAWWRKERDPTPALPKGEGEREEYYPPPAGAGGGNLFVLILNHGWNGIKDCTDFLRTTA